MRKPKRDVHEELIPGAVRQRFHSLLLQKIIEHIVVGCIRMFPVLVKKK